MTTAIAVPTPALTAYGGEEAEIYRDLDLETDVELAQDVLREATLRLRDLEKERKSRTREYLDAKAKVDAEYTEAKTIYEIAIEAANEVIKADRQVKREAADRALVEAKTTTEVQLIVAPPPKMEGIQTRKVLHVRILDEAKVPDAFWILDIHALKEEHRAGREVEGVEFYYEETLVVKS